MARIDLEVAVSSDETTVACRFDEAAHDPDVVVGWFTSDPTVRAEVRPNGASRWDVSIEGPGFRAGGPVRLHVVVDGVGQTLIVADVQVKPRGLLGLAGPLLGLATPRIENEARNALWKEFGRP
jgi:hypothetical protein